MRLRRWRLGAGAAFGGLYLAAALILSAPHLAGEPAPACLLLALATGAALTATWFSWQPALGLIGLSLGTILALQGLLPLANPEGRHRLVAYLLASLARA